MRETERLDLAAKEEIHAAGSNPLAEELARPGQAAQLSRCDAAIEADCGKVAEVKDSLAGDGAKMIEMGHAPEGLPEGFELPAGCALYDGPDDGKCRILKADGERCKGTRSLRLGGLCPGHGGTGIAANPAAYSSQGHAQRRRRANARAVLGISARRAASPLQAARVAAQIRADDFARAVVDDPLDDAELGSVARQRAAIAALELLYPQSTATLSVELPTEPDEVAGLGWAELQELAGSLLGAESQTEPDG